MMPQSAHFNEHCKRIASQGDVVGAAVLLKGLPNKHARSVVANALAYQITQFDRLTDEDLEKSLALMRLALKNGASPNHAPTDYSIFENACTQGHLKLVELLFEYRPEINPKDIRTSETKSATPLMLAIGQGHEDVVEFLLSKGADPEACNVFGETPLFWAVAYGQIDILELLYSRGASVNKVDNASNTLLHIVFINIDDYPFSTAESCIKNLIKWGVDPNQKDIMEANPIDLAKEIAVSQKDDRYLLAIHQAMAEKEAIKLDTQTPQVSLSARRRQI